MERKVIVSFRIVNGDKSLFRQWHQRFITALGQVEGAHEEIIQQLVKEKHHALFSVGQRGSNQG